MGFIQQVMGRQMLKITACRRKASCLELSRCMAGKGKPDLVVMSNICGARMLLPDGLKKNLKSVKYELLQELLCCGSMRSVFSLASRTASSPCVPSQAWPYLELRFHLPTGRSHTAAPGVLSTCGTASLCWAPPFGQCV